MRIVLKTNNIIQVVNHNIDRDIEMLEYLKLRNIRHIYNHIGFRSEADITLFILKFQK